MGHGKETPRQKMIGMMYLVLTAMLAMNVSKDVLDAFVIVDHGLHQTTLNFASKNEGLYGKFDLAADQNEAKAGAWKDKAYEVQHLSDELFEFINECKVDIASVKESDAIHDNELHLDEVAGKDDNNVPAQVMIVEKKGEELKKKIEHYRETMIETIENHEEYAGLIQSIEGNLSTHDHPSDKAGEPPHSWESHNFEHLPFAAVITILSEMQAAVRNVESDVLNYLLEQVDAKDFKVNVLEAVVLPTSNVVFKGQEYKAKVFLAAYDSTKVPSIELTGGEILKVESGKGVYSTVSNTAGERTWGGVLKLDNDGQVISRKFESTYRVTEASATISATKMNVFYRGVDNPVSISASGVTDAAVKPQLTSGKIRKISPGNYIVQPGPREDNSTVKVYAEVEGKQNFMGEMEFRVLNLPDPVAKVTGLPKGSGVLSLSQLTRLSKVDAEAEDFLFDVEYSVIGFKVNVMGSGGVNLIEESNSEAFTAAQKQIFQRMRPGQRVFIEDIQAIGPDGLKRTLNSINIKIN